MNRTRTIRSLARALTTMSLLAVFAVLLPACNTVEGVADDIRTAGRKTGDTADHVFTDRPSRD